MNLNILARNNTNTNTMIKTKERYVYMNATDQFKPYRGIHRQIFQHSYGT